MPGTDTTRIAAVSALYVLYLLVFVGFGPELLGVGAEAAVTALNCVLAVLVARSARGTVRTFFVLLALAFAADVLDMLTLRGDARIAVPAWDDQVGKNDIPVSFVFYGLFLFLWSCAWGLRALNLLRRQRSIWMYVVSGLVLAGIALLYAWQFRDYGLDILDAEQRFTILFFALELAGLLLGLLCVLLGVGRAYLFMIVGFALFAATDIVVIDLRLRGLSSTSVTLDPLWMLGRMLTLTGLLLLPRFRSRSDGEVARPTRFGVAAGGRHSALSALLLIFSLGAVFVAAVAGGLLGQTPHWLAMFYVLFSVVCVVTLAIITAHFDETVAYTQTWIRRLFGRRLEVDGWEDAPKRVRRMLEVTDLDSTLASAREAAGAFADDVIFLGPERLNRPAGRGRRSELVTCFLVMPFGAAWSAAVHTSIRTVCKAHEVRAVRGDDIFTPTDILDDIWRGILDADFVIADITGRNTNVFYELGMAHAIGKPVLILSQSADEVPIDLKTRRILMYDAADLPALEAGLERSIAEVIEKYGLRS